MQDNLDAEMELVETSQEEQLLESLYDETPKDFRFHLTASFETLEERYKWLTTPHEKLEGKTPAHCILEDGSSTEVIRILEDMPSWF
jgi:hypothetical protein